MVLGGISRSHVGHTHLAPRLLARLHISNLWVLNAILRINGAIIVLVRALLEDSRALVDHRRAAESILRGAFHIPFLLLLVNGLGGCALRHMLLPRVVGFSKNTFLRRFSREFSLALHQVIEVIQIQQFVVDW